MQQFVYQKIILTIYESWIVAFIYQLVYQDFYIVCTLYYALLQNLITFVNFTCHICQRKCTKLYLKYF